MRLSEIVGSPVDDADGRSLGVVLDLMASQDGPPLGPDARLMVRLVVVGRRSFGSHLGYSRPERQRGPWLVEALVRWRQGRVLRVAWDDLERTDDGRYVLARAAEALQIGRESTKVQP